MKPKISLITLGVTDLQRSLKFYRDGLGFPTHDYKEDAGIVFFKLEGTGEAPGLNLDRALPGGAGTPVISPIPTVTCGKWLTIPSWI